MDFYDNEGRNPMEVGNIIVRGALFLIADLPDRKCSNTCVGLFIEDDENYFLVTTFDSLWLADLAHVAENAKKAFQPENK